VGTAEIYDFALRRVSATIAEDLPGREGIDE